MLDANFTALPCLNIAKHYHMSVSVGSAEFLPWGYSGDQLISTYTIMATNTLLGILSASNSNTLIAALREEATTVFREHNGEWSKAAIAKLYCLDSVIRESSRVSGLGGTAMARRAILDGRIVLDGMWVAKSATVGVSMDSIHFDEAFCDRPMGCDAFLFSRRREERIVSEEISRVNEELVTTSIHWLPFSHGYLVCGLEMSPNAWILINICL